MSLDWPRHWDLIFRKPVVFSTMLLVLLWFLLWQCCAMVMGECTGIRSDKRQVTSASKIHSGCWKYLAIQSPCWLRHNWYFLKACCSPSENSSDDLSSGRNWRRVNPSGWGQGNPSEHLSAVDDCLDLRETRNSGKSRCPRCYHFLTNVFELNPLWVACLSEFSDATEHGKDAL